MAISSNNSQFVRALLEMVAPLKDSIQNADMMEAFLKELGYDAAFSTSEWSNIETAFTTLSSLFSNLEGLIDTLESNPGAELDTLEDILQVVKDIIALVHGFIASPPSLSFAPFNQAGFWADFFEDLLNYLVVVYVVENAGGLAGVLNLLGIFEISETPPTGVPSAPAPMTFNDTNGLAGYYKYKVNWNKLGDLITQPTQHLKDVYNWDGTGPMFHEKLFANLSLLFDLLEIPTRLETPGTPILDLFYPGSHPERNDIQALRIPLIFQANADWSDWAELGFVAMPITPTGNPAGDTNGLFFGPAARGAITSAANPGDSPFNFSFAGGFETDGFFRVEIRPSGLDFELDPSVVDLSAKADLKLDQGEPFVIVGSPDGHRIEIDKFYASLEVRGPISSPEVDFKAGTGEGSALRFIFEPGDGDGFLQKVLGDNPVTLEFAGDVSWSSVTGFGLNGHVGFSLAIPINKNIGPLGLKTLTLDAQVASGGDISLNVGLGISLELGPFTAVIDNVGAKMLLNEKTGGDSGTFGNLDIDWGFKPPTGIGLSLNSETIKGGGFLSFDYDNERYAGVLELTIKDKISVKAIGLLTTRFPDGSKGFSLLLLITAEFTPIQLGFGFTLSGVGGIIGVNRTMELDALRDGVRTNSLDNVLFPQDVVENAQQIISDLRTIFPPKEGRYAFGPMAKIGWGTPQLLTMEVGLMIELPSPVRIAILGVIKALLPDEAVPLIKLQVNFLGTIDFEKKFITFDASLFDSKLLNWTLEGDMAVRIKWGDESNFIFTVGGFHPSYTPPPLGLPTLRRLTLNLLGGDNPRLTLTSYFAVTSNTVQFGAGVDFYAKVISKVTVKGYMRFDALFQFSPFYFIITFEASLAVYWKSKSVMSLFLSVLLEGPTPWHAKGRAEFRVMGIKCKLKFDKTWGQNNDTSLPDVDVMPKLVEALTNKANWLATPATDLDNLVTLREMDTVPAGEVIAHPDSVMSVSQKIVPLGVTIQQFSNQKPSDYTKFTLELEDINGNPFDDEAVKEEFAPASYFSLTNDQKLSRPSFEKYDGGLSVKGTDELNSDYFRERAVEYEHILMDSRHQPKYFTNLVAMAPMEFNAFVRNGSAARCAVGSKAQMVSPLAPAKVSLAKSDYAVVLNDDLTVFEGRMASSHAEAQRIVDEVLADRPGLTNQIQVVPAFEIA